MSRKRNSLSQSISSLAASIPDIPLALGDDDTITAVATVSPEGAIKVKSVGGDHDSPTFTGTITLPVPSESPLDLFRAWSLTPEGHRVRDNRIPVDPVRLGCILDDNARIAYLAGYAAATPSFE